MAEWLKNICFSPFKYGLDKVNMIAVKVISLIFNLCGKRLLKIDIDKIIKNNECNENHNIFYLYPLPLKQIEQDIGLNLMKIEEGIINNLIISFPWKAMLSEPTLINISDISLVILFTKRINSIHFNNLENTNSYFTNNDIIIKENQDLLNTCKEIRILLTQYLNKINLEIELIEIILLDCFKITMQNIGYIDNVLNIGKIYIVALDNQEKRLVEINGLEFKIVQYVLSVHEINIDPIFFDLVPDFYTNETKSDFKFSIFVGIFKMDKIIAKEIIFNIDQDNLVIRKLSYLYIDEILFVKENSNADNVFLSFNFENNVCFFSNSMNIKIGDMTNLVCWSKEITNIMNTITNKLIIMNLNEPINKKPLSIINISTNIIYGDDIFDVFIEKIYIRDKINLDKIKILYDDTVGIFDNILVNKNGTINFSNSMVKCEKFNIKSDIIYILKDESKLDICFDSADVININEIINFVKDMIEKFTQKSNEQKNLVLSNQATMENINLSISVADLSDTLVLMENNIEPQKPLIINLNIQKSNISLKYENINFNIFVKNSNICITNKNASNIIADVLIDEYLIAKIDAEYISLNLIQIDSFHVFIDPEKFDLFNYLFGTLSPDSNEMEQEIEISPEELKQLRETLSCSIISDSIHDLEKTLNEKTNNILQNNTKQIPLRLLNIPSIKMLLTSFTNLRDILIDDYGEEPNDEKNLQIKISIKILRVYFFDKLIKYNSNSNSNIKNNNNAFLCAIIKEINFKKITESNDEEDKIGHNKNSKPKTKDKYLLKIKTGAFIDISCHHPEWKYFIKFSNNNMLDANIILCENSLRANIIISSLTANIREETLFRLLAFFSNSHHAPKNNNLIYIEYFNMSAISISVNYYPLILKQINMGPNIFTLKDYKIQLMPLILTNIDGINKLLNIIGAHWKADINPENILQFIPNIKILHPYTVPIIHFFQLTTRYFKRAKNKKKIRAITKNINHGVDIISSLVNHGVNQVWEFFN